MGRVSALWLELREQHPGGTGDRVEGWEPQVQIAALPAGGKTPKGSSSFSNPQILKEPWVWNWNLDLIEGPPRAGGILQAATSAP